MKNQLMQSRPDWLPHPFSRVADMLHVARGQKLTREIKHDSAPVLVGRGEFIAERMLSA